MTISQETTPGDSISTIIVKPHTGGGEVRASLPRLLRLAFKVSRTFLGAPASNRPRGGRKVAGGTGRLKIRAPPERQRRPTLEHLC